MTKILNFSYFLFLLIFWLILTCPSFDTKMHILFLIIFIVLNLCVWNIRNSHIKLCYGLFCIFFSPFLLLITIIKFAYLLLFKISGVNVVNTYLRCVHCKSLIEKIPKKCGKCGIVNGDEIHTMMLSVSLDQNDKKYIGKVFHTHALKMLDLKEEQVQILLKSKNYAGEWSSLMDICPNIFIFQTFQHNPIKL